MYVWWYDGMPKGRTASDWGLPRGRTRIAACWMEECSVLAPHELRRARRGEERRGEERVVEVGWRRRGRGCGGAVVR
jgi:hypothetical protein